MPRTRTLWLLFALFIVYGSTIPFHFTTSHEFVREKLHAIPLNPFVAPDTGRRLSIPDFVQNVLLYLPFGVLGLLSGRRGWGLKRLIWVTLLGTAFSAAIETFQLFTVDRVSSLGDVFANGLGTFVGAAGAIVTQGVAVAAKRRLDAAGLTQTTAFYPAATAVMILCVAAWQPFDVTLEVGSVYSKLKALSTDLWQAGAITDEGIAFLQYALASMAIAQWLRSLDRSRIRTFVPTYTLFGMAVMAFGLEASQVMITSRMPSLEDALDRFAGAALGLMLWPLVRQTVAAPAARSGWITLVFIATAVGAALQMWTPFEFSSFHSMGWFPFLGYYGHTSFETLSHVFELVLLYFPLGFCVGLANQSRGALVIALALTALIAMPVEIGQGWFVGRYPDATDVAVSLGGGFLGALLAQRRSSSLLSGSTGS